MILGTPEAVHAEHMKIRCREDSLGSSMTLAPAGRRVATTAAGAENRTRDRLDSLAPAYL